MDDISYTNLVYLYTFLARAFLYPFLEPKELKKVERKKSLGKLIHSLIHVLVLSICAE
jgi:hypothetical protein